MKFKHKRKVNYKEAGITLVALVVTIIVLLILAGVSIALITGNEGIISRTKDAKERYNNSTIQEESMMEEMEQEIAELVEDGEIDSTPGEFDGTGTEDNPYIILSIEDLVYLSNEVNGGNSFSGKYLKLGKSLDFNRDSSYAEPLTTTFGDINGNGDSEALKVEMTTGKGFTPIGNYNNTAIPFSGVFDGNKKSIRNLYMNVTDVDGEFDMGFFGFTNGTVKDLYMIDANLTNGCSASMTGVLAGNGVGTIQRCSATGNITSIKDDAIILCAGGLIGIVGDFVPASIDRCYTDVSISTRTNTTSAATYAGGIVGQMMFANHSVSNCYCIGEMNISAKIRNYTLVGGICGTFGSKQMGGNSTTKIEKCYSTEQISLSINNAPSNFYYTCIGLFGAPCTASNVFGLDESKEIQAANTSEADASGAVITNLETVNSTELKSATVLQELGNAFSIKEGKNGGYPVLDWQ